jgi:16S rRNA G1207 methylase RsmC
MAIKNQTEIKFSFGLNKELELTTSPDVFTPNTTTNLLIQAVQDTILEPVTLLDLGCGTGAVGLALHLQGLIKMPLYASDLSKPAVLCSQANFVRYECEADVRSGSLFQPWDNIKFDVIVDDISGISQSVADVSAWFQGVPCNTGKDGIDLVVKIIRNAPKYLNKGGRFFFPVLSLSNVDKLMQVAKTNFGTVECVGRTDWPLPTELKKQMTLFRKLRDEGSIKLEEKFGMVLCYTEVYCATNPIFN